MTPLPVSTKPTAHEDQQVNQTSSSSRQDFAFGLASPVARQEQLLLSEYLSDMVFQVGSTGQLMHAHKLILTVASEVFYAQFNGGFNEGSQDNREKPIVVEDIEPEIFKQVLRYIYCEKVDLTPDNVMDVYCVSEKYLLTGLNTVCHIFLKKTLNVHNVLKVFNANRRYGFTNVDELCLNIIRDNPVKCFQSNDFLTLSKPALELIAASRTMNCQMDQLVTAIQKWCKANDSEADIKPQLEALRCDKLCSFSAFRYDTNISTALKIKVKGRMNLHGLGVFVGRKPNCSSPLSVVITVKIEPWNVTVSRTIFVKKSLYVEDILFEKLTVTDECRIIVTFPTMDLFCLEEFKPVDTLGALELTVTDMKVSGEFVMPGLSLPSLNLDLNAFNQPLPRVQPSYQPAQRRIFGQPGFGNYSPAPPPPVKETNCVAYLLYSLDPAV